MRLDDLEISLKFAWWWRWLYVPGLMILIYAGGEPNWERVKETLTRAVRIRYTVKPKGSISA